MKVQSGSLHFFLGSDEEKEDSDDEEEDVSHFACMLEMVRSTLAISAPRREVLATPPRHQQEDSERGQKATEDDEVCQGCTSGPHISNA